MKIYVYKGKTYQFADGDVPEGAVEVKAKQPVENKAKAAPKTKAAKQ